MRCRKKRQMRWIRASHFTFFKGKGVYFLRNKQWLINGQDLGNVLFFSWFLEKRQTKRTLTDELPYWVELTLILVVPLSAQFYLGWWEFGRSGWATGKDGGTPKSKSTQHRSQQVNHPVDNDAKRASTHASASVSPSRSRFWQFPVIKYLGNTIWQTTLARKHFSSQCDHGYVTNCAT